MLTIEMSIATFVRLQMGLDKRGINHTSHVNSKGIRPTVGKCLPW